MQTRVLIPNLPTRFDAATGSRIPSLDLNPAAKFGMLINATEGPLDHDYAEPIEDVKRAVGELEADDYILCVGDLILTAAAMKYACELHGSCKLLRWVKNRHSYEVSEVRL